MEDMASVEKEFTNKVLKLAMQYAFPGGLLKVTDEKPKIFELRDALLHRFRAILFHREAFRNIKRSFENDLIENFSSHWHNPGSMIQCTDYQAFIFDDIIFNIISLFDYFGNLIGFIFCEDKGWQLRWNRAYKISKNGNGKVASYPVAELIVENHENWVAKLFEYRASLIHYQTDDITASQTITVSKGITEFHINAINPKKFLKMFRNSVFFGSESKDVSISNIVDVLIFRTIQCINEMVESITNSLPQILSATQKVNR